MYLHLRAILQNQQLGAGTMLKYLQRAEKKKTNNFSIALYFPFQLNYTPYESMTWQFCGSAF